MREKLPIIQYLFSSLDKKEEKFKNLEAFDIYDNSFQKKDLSKVPKTIKKHLKNYCEKDENKEFFIKIYGKEVYLEIANQQDHKEKEKIQNVKEVKNENQEEQSIKEKKNTKDKELDKSSNTDFNSIKQISEEKNSNNAQNNENMEAPEIEHIEMNSEIAKHVLSKSTFIIHLTKEKKMIKYDNIFLGNNTEISYQTFKESLGSFSKDNILHTNYKKFFQYLNNIEKEMITRFKYNYNLMVKLEFQKEEMKNKGINESLYNISSTYSYFPPNNMNCYSYSEDNILVDNINSNNQGFNTMIYDINNAFYQDYEYKEYKTKEQMEKIILNDLDTKEKIPHIPNLIRKIQLTKITKLI